MIDVIITENHGEIKRIIQRNKAIYDIYVVENGKWIHCETCSEDSAKFYLSDLHLTIHKLDGLQTI